MPVETGRTVITHLGPVNPSSGQRGDSQTERTGDRRGASSPVERIFK